MRGSLESPPIIIHESLLSWGATLTLGVMGLGASLYAIFGNVRVPPEAGWIGGAVSGIFLAWRYFHPARIEIWPDRFAWTGFFAMRQEFAFADIEEFVTQLRRGQGFVVGFNLRADSPRRTKLAVVAEVLDGVDKVIGGSWEIPADQLLDLLNRTRLLPSAWR